MSAVAPRVLSGSSPHPHEVGRAREHQVDRSFAPDTAPIERTRSSGARLSISIATPDDRNRIYALRHSVYAVELQQHKANVLGVLNDALDDVNEYLVVKAGEEIAGFIAITSPGNGWFSIDKYFSRADLPIEFDDSVYEIRLLTVLPAFRGTAAAALLMYGAFRFVESAGGKRIVCIGRSEFVRMYENAGLRRLGFTARAGRVTYELMSMNISDGPSDRHDVLSRIRQNANWEIRGTPFSSGGQCFHGGAFFDAVGDEFDNLDSRHRVINADVLDAWFDPAPSVIDALGPSLGWALRTSPPTGMNGMHRTIGAARHVSPENVLAGGGSSDLIFLGLRHWLDARSRVLILDPMYGEYAHVLERVIGCTVDRLTLARSSSYDVDIAELRRRCQDGYDWIVLVNPNSPTGRRIPREILEELIVSCPQSTRFWIDETYVDYAGPDQSLEQFAAASKNVVVCKSMSKAYALSGARCAYVCGPAHLISELRGISPPWAVGLPAQIAACEALRSLPYYLDKWQETAALRTQLSDQLRGLGWDVVEGCANFLLCHLPHDQPSAADLIARCQRSGLFIRDVRSMGSCFDERTVRVAVKDRETTLRMLGILESAVSTTQQ